MKIFITGATGFLGGHLVRELAPHCETLFLLTRKNESPLSELYSNVVLIKGDITNQILIEHESDRLRLIEECDVAIHAAALYDLEASHAECYMQNIVGTQNVLRLIRKMKKITSFYYVSTIAVGDDQRFFLEEDQLLNRTTFNDYYSETKYHAERLVRECWNKHEDLAGLRIIRPGIIVGDSIKGDIPKVDGPYYFMEAMKKFAPLLKTLPLMPLSFNPRTKIPLIPVDHCASAIARLVFNDKGEKKTKTYHLISDQIPSVQDFLNDLNEHLGLKTRFVPVMKNPLHDTLLKLIGIPKSVVPFMFSKLSYDKTRTLEELPELKMSRYNDYKDRLFGKL